MTRDVETWVRLLTYLPILICSIVGFGLALAKSLELRRARTGERVLEQARRGLVAGDFPRVLPLVRGDRSPVARLIERVLPVAGQPAARVSDSVEQSGREVARQLEYGLGGLALIATLGPLLGLFGTVVGIIIVFERLAAEGGLVTAQQLAGGIGTALYTTMAGLLVGVFALVTHRFLTAWTDDVIAGLETAGRELARLLAVEEEG
jgi:biopolymer transport protein ExbB